jgi:hypothetical protein
MNKISFVIVLFLAFLFTFLLAEKPNTVLNNQIEDSLKNSNEETIFCKIIKIIKMDTNGNGEILVECFEASVDFDKKITIIGYPTNLVETKIEISTHKYLQDLIDYKETVMITYRKENNDFVASLIKFPIEFPISI